MAKTILGCSALAPRTKNKKIITFIFCNLLVHSCILSEAEILAHKNTPTNDIINITDKGSTPLDNDDAYIANTLQNVTHYKNKTSFFRSLKAQNR